jgi:hypothetical protein
MNLIEEQQNSYLTLSASVTAKPENAAINPVAEVELVEVFGILRRCNNMLRLIVYHQKPHSIDPRQ